MDKLKIIEINCETGEEVLREMSELELAEYQQRQIDAENERLVKEDLKAKRQALLNKLGITEDEAKLLLGGN